MNLPELCIRRPVMTTLLMAGILIFGMMSYSLLPISDLPNVDFPTVMVFAQLPGASPETMASSVAKPLEKQFSAIAGLDSMSSTSTEGVTRITLSFTLDRSVDAAAQDVSAAIAYVQGMLPAEMPSPPLYLKLNPAMSPILFMALTSPDLPLSDLNEYGETLMAERISTVSGVAQVQVYGQKKYAVRIQLDPRELATRGIGIDEVATAVRAANVNLPTGRLYGEHRAYTVEAEGQLTAAAEYRKVIVTYRNGAPARLEDVGEVIDSVQDDKMIAWYCTPEVMQNSVILAVQRQPGTNTVEVAAAVKRLLPTFRAQLPASVEAHLMYDASESIKESVQDVRFTLALALALVVMVIFLFLRNLSATIIPALTLPMSIIGTFSVMYLMGYSLDNLSLMALTLSVGFVVDDAIVMLENIVRHLEMGKKPFEAASDGAREIGFTIISMTVSLVAVFIPVLFMGGIVGRLFREFGVTIGVAVLVSGFVSLTLTPMMGSRFLRRREGKYEGFHASSGGFFGRALKIYERQLQWCVRHRRLGVGFTVAILIGTFGLARFVPMTFLPTEDRNMLFCNTEGAQDVSPAAMARNQMALNDILRRDPNIVDFMAVSGGGRASSGANTGMMFIKFKPRAERKKSVDQLQQELRVTLNQLPGLQAYLQNPTAIETGTHSTKSSYQYTLQGSDTDELYRYAAIVEEKLRGLPGFQDVTTDLQLNNPKVTVEIDRDKAATLGVSAEQIETALYSAYGSRLISRIYAPNNDYEVIMELKPECQSTPNALSLLNVRSRNGVSVPLDAVAQLKQEIGPLSVNHLGQLPAVTVSYNLAPGVALGEAQTQVNRIARETLPKTVNGSHEGTSQAFQSTSSGMLLALIMAVLVIYLTLGILYESFIHPLTILSALPFAGFGAILTLFIFNTPLSIYAFVGIIMLVGLVKKNGIMMIDFALEAQRKDGAPPAEAIVKASLIRFRPIMMTTMAALMASLPIAIGIGASGEARQPLGLAVVGGLIFSQALTLYVTPVIYIYMDKLQRLFTRAPRATPPPIPAE